MTKKQDAANEKAAAQEAMYAAQRAAEKAKQQERYNEQIETVNVMAGALETQAQVLIEVVAGEFMGAEDFQDRLQNAVHRVSNLLVAYIESRARAEWMEAEYGVAHQPFAIPAQPLAMYQSIIDAARARYTHKPDTIETWYRAADRATLVITDIISRNYDGSLRPESEWVRSGLEYKVQEDGTIRQSSNTGIRVYNLAGFIKQ